MSVVKLVRSIRSRLRRHFLNIRNRHNFVVVWPADTNEQTQFIPYQRHRPHHHHHLAADTTMTLSAPGSQSERNM